MPKGHAPRAPKTRVPHPPAPMASPQRVVPKYIRPPLHLCCMAGAPPGMVHEEAPGLPTSARVYE